MKISIKILIVVQQLFHKIYPGLHYSESRKVVIQSRIHIQEHLIILDFFVQDNVIIPIHSQHCILKMDSIYD